LGTEGRDSPSCSTDNSHLTALVVVVAIVHYMNSLELFFWRSPQMKGFAPFVAMLHHRVGLRPEHQV
jgi:hypothetical protein